MASRSVTPSRLARCRRPSLLSEEFAEAAQGSLAFVARFPKRPANGATPHASKRPALRAPTYVLGINAYHAGASACLLQDGELVAAAEEERFNRVKYCAGFPTAA